MARTKRCILIVEDDDAERTALARVLRLEGFEVRQARQPSEALTLLDTGIDLVISDLCMGERSGLDLLQAWHLRLGQAPFLLLTAFGTVDTAVKAMKLGAADFLTKPVDPVQLLGLIHRLLGPAPAGGEAATIMDRFNAPLGEAPIIGQAPALVEVCAQTLRAAASASTVLILGESGTGKELIAQALHLHSPRRDGPFTVINMAAIPEALVESELFGHVKGAFTTALTSRAGRFETARGGTLFIDEIGDFPLPLQAKLLRVLEARRLTPLGSDTEVPTDVRVVAASSRPLSRMVQTGAFREDLYYRLNVIGLQLPPLRQRRQDIPLLTQHFLAQLATATGRQPPRVVPELLRELEAGDWPGNVRQLRNCLERMFVLASGETLTPADLPADWPGSAAPDDLGGGARLEAMKRTAMLEAIAQFGGNRTRAAEFLGISVRTLQRKLKDWGASGAAADNNS